MTRLDSRLREALLLAAILLAFCAVRWPFREATLIRDEGEYAYLGQSILRGEVPYRDVYNQKTPVAFYTLAAGQALFGSSVSALRGFGTAYGAATTAALYGLARGAFGPLGAAVAALSFGAMVFDQAGILHQASTEFFMLGWLVLGVWAWQRAAASGRPGLAAAAGALAGLACQTKQSGAVLLLFFVAESFWRRRREGRAALGAAARECAWALGGFAAVFAAVLAFFAAQGALGAYVECAWLHLGGFVGERYRDALGLRRVTDALGLAGRDAGLWLAGALGLLHLARRERGALAGGWLLALGLAAAALAAGSVYRHYYLPLALPMALGVGALAHAWRTEHSRVKRIALALAVCLPWLGPLLHGAELVRIGAEGRAHMTRGFQPFDKADVVARAIAERTRPGEPFLIVGSEPEIYYLAERPAGTRLIHIYTATGPYAFAPALRRELMTDLREKRPRYVLLVNMISSLTEWPEQLHTFLPPILETLRAEYVIEERWAGTGGDGVLGGVGDAQLVLWRRRD